MVGHGEIELLPLGTHAPGDGFNLAAMARNVRLPDSCQRRRVYEAWHDLALGGRNRFLCAGRCMVGPNIDKRFQMCTFCALFVPSLFYFVFCMRYLWEKVETQRLQMMRVRQPMDACADRHSAVLDCFAVASDGLY
ncbi:ZDHHC14 [Symbiodinium necroappetens]|uniref:ZDHHC14 protein n=1 Tax=Symbiodinium necroappetens TaxID=1628268 RepID=A0A812QQR7_9DINO|nr:ZDHHC14 [Symbiodinium necroappetens]